LTPALSRTAARSSSASSRSWPPRTQLVPWPAFVSGTGFDDLPPEVVEKTKYVVLDQLGCQLACSTLPWNELVCEHARSLGAVGHSTVVADGLETHPEAAALVNATFGHGFEIDDFHLGCFAHPGCVAVPAALAMAEHCDLDGRELILAAALGAEVLLRVGRASGRSAVVERGFHETSMQGPFGAAAAASKALRLDGARTVNALSIAGSHASGTLEYGQSGGDVKRLHAGIAAAGGIRSAFLAERGLTGPPTILEGRRGVFQAFANTFDATAAVAGLCEHYHLSGVGFKAYCCMGLIHAQIDAVARILDEHPIRAEEIDEIVIGTSKLGLSHGGSIGPRPTDITAAQFSSHFGIGLTVAVGANDFAAYRDAQAADFADPRVVDVASRVKVIVDEACERAFPAHNMATATIRTRDGLTFSATVPEATGFPDNPLPPSAIEEKFLRLATTILPGEQAKQLKDTILNLEAIDNVKQLTGLLLAEPAGAWQA
jgi:2-methylcitrate dehydratase PrpD